MGKTKIATIDDSAQEEVKEKPSTHPSFGGKKKFEKAARSSESEVTGAVEPTVSIIPSDSEESAVNAAQNESGDSSSTPQNDKPKKVQKPGKAKLRSKKYQELSKNLDRTKTYPLTEAIEMVKKLSYSKFNGTLEAHINTAQTGIRGLVSLPYSSGKKLRILVFGAKTPIEDTTSGDDSTIESISKERVDFDLVITTPDWMPKLTKAAKVLGPRGLMPNPKNSTITDDLKKTVEGFQAGKTEYKTESKVPVIHLALGKLNQPTKELSANIKTLLQTIGKTRVKKVTLSPTMGPSVKIELSNTFS